MAPVKCKEKIQNQKCVKQMANLFLTHKKRARKAFFAAREQKIPLHKTVPFMRAFLKEEDKCKDQQLNDRLGASEQPSEKRAPKPEFISIEAVPLELPDPRFGRAKAFFNKIGGKFVSGKVLSP